MKLTLIYKNGTIYSYKGFTESEFMGILITIYNKDSIKSIISEGFDYTKWVL